MKLFIDDVRTPPAGWELARTPAMAKTMLRLGNVHEVSMDYDLGGKPPPFAPLRVKEGWKGASPNGTGADIARWMVREDQAPTKFRMPAHIRIHSHNPEGAAEIAAVLQAGGLDPEIREWNYDDEFTSQEQNPNEPVSPSPNEPQGPDELEVADTSVEEDSYR